MIQFCTGKRCIAQYCIPEFYTFQYQSTKNCRIKTAVLKHNIMEQIDPGEIAVNESATNKFGVNQRSGPLHTIKL